MKPHSILLCCVMSFLIASFSSLARAESYARVCVTTVDTESREAPLTEKSSLASGEKLVVHLDASSECTALILPFVEHGRKLVNGWRPQIVELAQWDEKTLPDSRRVWDWNKGADPFELWIFFFKRDALGLEEMQKLVTAMQNSNVNDQVLAQQTRKLCEKLSSRMSGNAQIVQGPKADATLIGGTTRRADFPWRDYAQKVALNSALEGELVVRHGR